MLPKYLLRLPGARRTRRAGDHLDPGASDHLVVPPPAVDLQVPRRACPRRTYGLCLRSIPIT